MVKICQYEVNGSTFNLYIDSSRAVKSVENNNFQICTLKHSDSQTAKRQEWAGGCACA